MLCVGTCKALHWHLQSFALAHAMLCVGQYTAVHLPIHCFALANTLRCVGRWVMPMSCRLPARVSSLLYPKWNYSWFTLTTCSQKIHWPARAVSAEAHSPGCHFASLHLPWAVCFCAYSACWSIYFLRTSSQSKSGTVPFWVQQTGHPSKVIKEYICWIGDHKMSWALN